MKFIREHIVLKFFWMLMALHVFNFSVDIPDPQPNQYPEDLSINDMESIAEIFLEKILEIENAVPEHEEHDDDNGKFNNIMSIDCLDKLYLDKLSQNITKFPVSFLFKEKYSSQFHPELIPPPPKA
jgi:hypothetical protein